MRYKLKDLLSDLKESYGVVIPEMEQYDQELNAEMIDDVAERVSYSYSDKNYVCTIQFLTTKDSYNEMIIKVFVEGASFTYCLS